MHLPFFDRTSELVRLRAAWAKAPAGYSSPDDARCSAALARSQRTRLVRPFVLEARSRNPAVECRRQ